MGILEEFQSSQAQRASLEPQTGVPHLLRIAVEPEAPGQKTFTHEGEDASVSSVAAEPGLVR